MFHKTETIGMQAVLAKKITFADGNQFFVKKYVCGKSY